MPSLSNDFLAAVLGPPGAALAKSLKNTDLGSYLPARAALGWVQVIDKHGDTVPGTMIPCNLVKHSVGWSGHLGTYHFERAPIAHVAAALAVHLGAVPGRPDLRDVDLARFGKTVDTLAKAQKRRGAAGEGGLNIAAAPQAPVPPEAAIQPGGEAVATAAQTKQAKARKITLPGAKLKAPLPGTKLKTPLPKLPQIRVTKAEAQRPCSLCKSRQFEGSSFVGCICYRALSKSVATKTTPLGYELTLGSGWDMDGALSLLKTFKSNL